MYAKNSNKTLVPTETIKVAILFKFIYGFPQRECHLHIMDHFPFISANGMKTGEIECKSVGPES